MTRLLLRFDDLCPTMRWGVWDRVERLLDEKGVKPILAIVPENRDPKLMVEPANPLFWDRARAWQAKGWIIGQHGYQHVYDSSERGLVPWWPQSEFAGHTFEVQRDRVVEGMKALQVRGLNPRVWVAPSHSFDATTLTVLARVGLSIVSDGVGFRSSIDEAGLVWIPVQPWRLPGPRRGTATICIHHNAPGAEEALRRLLTDSGTLRAMAGVGFGFDDVVREAKPRSAVDRLFERAYWSLFSGRRALRSILRGSTRRPAPRTDHA